MAPAPIAQAPLLGLRRRVGRSRRSQRGAALMALVLMAWSAPRPVQAEGQVQLSCAGTLLETRGQAELTRATSRLLASLSLSAEGSSSDLALEQLQRRLAAVRSELQALGVKQLQVSSPSTWQRQAQGGRPAAVEANLQVGGQLEPGRLQALIRQVGSLPGVQLAPVRTQADPGENERVRQELLRLAYQDALRQARPLAELTGSRSLRPLEIRSEGGLMPPIAMRAMASDGVAPFNPRELEQPKDRLELLVRFCSQ